MRCNKVREWLSLELDDQLPPDKTFSLDEHLEHCEECRTYRTDLQLGHRLLRATEPQLSENFEWRMQLKLNQTLREMARLATLPWDEPSWSLRPWLRNFGLATAAGLAAVVAVAMLILPVPEARDGGGSGDPPSIGGTIVVEASAETSDGIAAVDSTRRPFITPTRPWFTPGGPHLVDTSERDRPRVPTRTNLGIGWTGNHLVDLRTITDLRGRNRQLRENLRHLHTEYDLLKRQLDSAKPLPVDHEEPDE